MSGNLSLRSDRNNLGAIFGFYPELLQVIDSVPLFSLIRKI